MSAYVIVPVIIAIVAVPAIILIFVTRAAARYWRDRWPEDQSRPREDK